jgi:hypothetical protein
MDNILLIEFRVGLVIKPEEESSTQLERLRAMVSDIEAVCISHTGSSSLVLKEIRSSVD